MFKFVQAHVVRKRTSKFVHLVGEDQLAVCAQAAARFSPNAGEKEEKKGEKKIQTHNRKIVDNIIDKLQIIINAAKVTRPMM